MAQDQVRPLSLREVWTRKLIYPGHTLPTALAPALVAVGLAVHDDVLAPVPAAIAFLCGWLIQFGGVVTDNYENLKHNPIDREHPELVQALQTGLLTLRTLRGTVVASYGLALLGGVFLTFVAGLPVVIIGLASIAASWLYSAGPWPFGRQGLADPVFLVFFGIVSVVGTYYVQAASVHPGTHWTASMPLLACVAGLAIGVLATDILIIDDVRDRRVDVEKGKHTIAVRFGPVWSRLEFTALLLIAYLVPVWLWRGLGLGAIVLLPWLSLPAAIAVAGAIWTRDSFRELVPMTPRMALVQLLYALLLAGGLAAAGPAS
jgi:1,4-dihydroxy-2-naphthoate octaprenyltransferase